MNETKEKSAAKGRLRALVYAGLAGGMVGVCGLSVAAHGNASPASAHSAGSLTWNADDFVVQQPAAPDTTETAQP